MGYIKIKFDKKMRVPDFAKKGRRLKGDNLGLNSIDVSRDLLNLDFILKSDVELKDIKYGLELKKWNE